MSSLHPLLLHLLHEYDYPVLWLTEFIAAIGLPLSTSLVLLAAGVFASRGDFNIALLIGITITASSCGDNVGYFIGRVWGSSSLNTRKFTCLQTMVRITWQKCIKWNFCMRRNSNDWQLV